MKKIPVKTTKIPIGPYLIFLFILSGKYFVNPTKIYLDEPKNCILYG